MPKLLRNPWLYLLIASIPLLVGIGRLEKTADTRVFINPASEEFKQLQELENRFGRQSTTYFAISLPGYSLFSTEYRKFISDFQNELWQIPSALSVLGLGSLPHPYSDNEDLAVVPIIELENKDRFLEAISKIALKGIVVSSKANWTGVYVDLEVPDNKPGAVLRVEEQINQAVERMRASYPKALIYMTGEIGLMSAFAHSAENDNATLVPTGLLLMILVAAIGIPSFRILAILGSVVIFCSSFALALQGYFGGPVNSATAIVPLIVIVIVTANMMHLLWGMYLTAATWPVDVGLLDKLVAQYRRPIILSGVTTAFGFFLLLLADSPPFRELGWVVGSTTLLSTLMTVCWVPAALKSFKTVASTSGARGRMLLDFAGWLFLLGRNKATFWIFLILCIASCFGLMRVSVNDNFVEYFAETSDFRVGSDVLQQVLGGPNYLELTLSTALPDDDLFGQEAIDSWRELEIWLRSQEIVSGLTSVSESIKELEQLLGEIPAEQLLLVHEMGLPVGQELASRVTPDRKHARITVLLNTSDSREILKLRDAIQIYVSDSHQSIRVLVGGVSVPTSEMSEKNTNDVLLGVGLTAILMSLFMSVIYRDVRVLIIVLVSVALPITMGFGLWGWFKGDVGLAAAAILAATLGVVIDDVIHIVHRYSSLRTNNWHSSESAIVEIMRVTAPPIFLTSCVLALGFGVLLFSEFGVNRALGITVALIIICAIAVVFILTPKLLEHVGTRSILRRLAANK